MILHSFFNFFKQFRMFDAGQHFLERTEQLKQRLVRWIRGSVFEHRHGWTRAIQFFNLWCWLVWLVGAKLKLLNQKMLQVAVINSRLCMYVITKEQREHNSIEWVSVDMFQSFYSHPKSFFIPVVISSGACFIRKMIHLCVMLENSTFLTSHSFILSFPHCHHVYQDLNDHQKFTSVL